MHLFNIWSYNIVCFCLSVYLSVCLFAWVCLPLFLSVICLLFVVIGTPGVCWCLGVYACLSWCFLLVSYAWHWWSKISLLQRLCELRWRSLYSSLPNSPFFGCYRPPTADVPPTAPHTEPINVQLFQNFASSTLVTRL